MSNVVRLDPRNGSGSGLDAEALSWTYTPARARATGGPFVGMVFGNGDYVILEGDENGRAVALGNEESFDLALRTAERILLDLLKG